MNIYKSKLKMFVDDTNANFAIPMAVGIGVILLGIGAAFDITDAVNIRSKLASSTDNAVLTAAVSDKKTPKELQALARTSFDANYDYKPGHTLKSFKLTKPSDNRIRVETILTYQPVFAKLFGLDTRDIRVSADSTLPEVSRLDVALVLDRTGSMAGRNMTNLKTAAKGFLNDLEDSDADVRVSVIPFAHYVNIGLSYADEDWLDLPGNNSNGSDAECSMEDSSTSTCFNPNSPPQNCQTGTTSQTTDDGTTRRTTTTTTTDNGDGTCTVSTRVEEVSQGASSVSTSTVTTSGASARVSTNWANVSQTTTGNYCTYSSDPSESSGSLIEECSVRNIVGDWYGCVGSRTGNNNIEVSYNRKKIPPAMELTCGQAIKSLSSDMKAAEDVVTSLTASGATYIPAGLMWGWRSLTPSAPLEIEADGERSKLIILMTDGQNTVSQSGLFHTGTDYKKANKLTESLCNKIKESGTKIATLSYSSGSRDSTTTKLLEQCASTGELYFEPRNAQTLKEAFEDAINSTTNIRLVE